MILSKSFSGGRSTDPKTGEMVYEMEKYLTEKYDAATIMIGEPSAFIGQGRELKIDHLCLCLDAHAHGMKENHPIFNKPFKLEMPKEYVEFTGNYHARYGGRNLGKGCRCGVFKQKVIAMEKDSCWRSVWRIWF